MAVIYVARSVKFSKWASDVGLSKHVLKVGVSEDDPKPIVEQGWGGESDWTLLRKREVEGIGEDEVIERLSRKEKMVDPAYYPRLRGARGIFKVPPEHVESHIIVARSIAGALERAEIKLKPADFADFLIHNALR
jgi:hypothetical protein